MERDRAREGRAKMIIDANFEKIYVISRLQRDYTEFVDIFLITND